MGVGVCVCVCVCVGVCGGCIAQIPLPHFGTEFMTNEQIADFLRARGNTPAGEVLFCLTVIYLVNDTPI